MKRYAFLVRGINVGGRNKVVMEKFCHGLEKLGFKNVSSYINSGNLFFDSPMIKEELLLVIEEFLNKSYPFITVFSLFTLEEYQNECKSLPKWWENDLYRKDVLFYTVQLDKDELKRVINSFDLADETLHFGELGVYWGKHDKTSYNQTAYHKKLLKSSFYPYITIRNARTFLNIGYYLKNKELKEI